MLTDEELNRIEADIIIEIDNIRIKKGLSMRAISSLAFPNQSGNGAERKMQEIFSGRHKKLTLAEIYRLCDALDVEPLVVLAKVTLENK